MEQSIHVTRQYDNAEPLSIRIQTHSLYTDKKINLNDEAISLMELVGQEAVLDAGCGTGGFLRHLLNKGHQGRLVGVDQSAGMVEQTKCEGIEGILGDVRELPFTDSEFQWVTARHMLYHVPDIPQALRQFDRVLAPGGHILAITNSNNSLQLIKSLYNDMLQAFGYPVMISPVTTFCVENAMAILGEVFAEVKKTLLTNALVFRESAPIVRYISSMFSYMSIPNDPRLYDELLSWLEVEAERRLQQYGGVWTDPKQVGIYLACNT
ncbi:class I SAM-dependent methyltransferase [Paenibacillus sp. UNC451MF]|uniref:class I SAM-dependent methyltransferase n=1 Tax=Paenibacillus sp. UNC451MF TaxID=1449063 RepID=UPI00068B19D7|nr:class I SAM-dependent methyltransferase [Paenibacillus sp. UNC451MF]